jgi:colicin import membrane protein
MQRASDRWVSITLSVLLHGLLVAALVYGWLLFRSPPAPHPTLAIEANVVDARAVKGGVRAPPQPAPPVPAAAPTPEPAPPEEPTGPPQPSPEELAQREAQRQQAEAAAEQQRRAAEEKAAAEAAQAETQRKAEEERQAQARAAADKKARAAAEAQKRAAAEQLRQQQALDQSAREDLQHSLAAEEHADTARSSAAVANWEALIAAKITRAWLRPPTARPGLECLLNVTQVPGGVVTKVSFGQCNGDQAVRDSIEAAVYRASPLPPPPAGARFDPDLHIDFKPD